MGRTQCMCKIFDTFGRGIGQEDSNSLPHLVASLTRCHMCRLADTETHNKFHKNACTPHIVRTYTQSVRGRERERNVQCRQHSLFIYLSTLLYVLAIGWPKNEGSACFKRAINLPYKSFNVQLLFFYSSILKR